MILIACECGSPYMVEDQYAGGTLACTACGHDIQIPTTSDPRVALVFRAGESEDGVPMLREEVERLVAAGEFSEAELIWDGTTWRPVTEVFGVESTEHSKLHLKRPGDEVVEEEGELAFDGIEPIQKVQLDDEELRQLPTPRREKKKREKKKKEKAAKTQAEEGGVRLLVKRVFGSDPSMGPKVNIPVQIFWVLVVFFCGYRFGVGPLVSKFREMPTYVVVFNNTNTECTASLGWRRLKKDILPNTSATYELYVGMLETQTVTLTPKGEGPVVTARVPMWPGGLTVVNPEGKLKFAQIEPGAAKNESLLSSDVRRLADQIRDHREPSGVTKLIPEGLRIAKKAVVETRTDEVFTSEQFRFDRGILQGDAEAIKVFMDALNERQKSRKKQYDLIVYPPQRTVDFKGGRAMVDLRDEKRVDMEIWLPEKKFSVGIQTLTVKENPKLEVVQGRDGKLVLTMEIPYTTKFGNRSYKGSWRYQATESKGNWSWQWSFSGADEKAPKGLKRVEYRYDQNRKPYGPKFS